MSLLTRCPRCKTLFRVTPAQLQTRAGTVRCGRCMHVFDAYEALAVDKTPALTAPAQAEPSPARDDAPDAQTATATPAPVPVPAPAAAPAHQPAPPWRAEQSPPPVVAPVPSTASHATPTAHRRTTSTLPPVPLGQPLLRQPTPQQLWAAGAIGVAILLALQMTFAYRSELAARYPLMRSALTWICDHTGCRVTLPQRPELVRIEASDVHMIDANRPQLIQLTATLRSYANYDLAYPALDLVLTNATEHALARRIFVPDEYLDQARDPQAGIPANAEITLALDLDTGNLNAAGFRLQLLAAPAP